jgi:mannose-6-phosphate isomerase-like protein (cupin superfamily)
MKFPGRRVVTGHDANGRAIVQFDGVPQNVISRRAGHSSAVLWTTDSSPADNSGHSDDALRKVDRAVANGTVFRVAQLAPGVASARHRTESIDYIVILSGEIDMELDGTEVHLKAGDFLVQRGTIHNWVNRGKESCVYMVILVGAKPVTMGAKVLDSTG